MWTIIERLHPKYKLYWIVLKDKGLVAFFRDKDYAETFVRLMEEKENVDA